MKNWQEGKGSYLISSVTHELAHVHTSALANSLFHPLGKREIEGAKGKLIRLIYFFLSRFRGSTPSQVRFLHASL